MRFFFLSVYIQLKFSWLTKMTQTMNALWLIQIFCILPKYKPGWFWKQQVYCIKCFWYTIRLNLPYCHLFADTDGLKDKVMCGMNPVSSVSISSVSTPENKSSVYSLAEHSHSTHDSKDDMVNAAIEKDNNSNLFIFHIATRTFVCRVKVPKSLKYNIKREQERDLAKSYDNSPYTNSKWHVIWI